MHEKKITAAHYDIIASLFDYPEKDFAVNVKITQQYLNQFYPEAAEKLKPFTGYILKATLSEKEELFTRSFDVQSITTLDIGYVLFGDDYKRAEILVNFNREHKDANNDCGNELADHLPNVLRLISKMSNRQLVEELAEKIIGPAVFKMKGEFAEEKINKKNKVYQKHHKTIIEVSKQYGTLYQCALEALYRVLQDDFGIKEPVKSKQTNDFLNKVETEIKLEKE